MKNNLLMTLSRVNTPAFLYVDSFHENQIKKLIQKIGQYNTNTYLYYSVKTNDSKFVLEKLAKHVAGMEVISLRELELVKSIPDVKRIIVNGPSKNERFLKESIEFGAYINIDNEDEFYLLEKILKEKNLCIDAGLRLMYGKSTCDNKFGVSTDCSFYNRILSEKDSYNKHIKITGLHSHVSSYSESIDEFHMRVSDMKQRADDFEQNGINIQNLNIGGGFEPVIRLNNTMEWEIISDFDEKNAVLKNIVLADPDFFADKSLIMEPGRALSEAAILGVGEIITVKSLKDRCCVFMNFSTAFAGGSHPAESCISMFILEKNSRKLFPLKRDAHSKTMLCGPLCSGSDNFGFYEARNFCVGDRVILLNAGAYSLSFRWHGPEKLPEIIRFSEEKI